MFDYVSNIFLVRLFYPMQNVITTICSTTETISQQTIIDWNSRVDS